MKPLIGQRSTHKVTCIVCGQSYGNAAVHDCPYVGIGLRKKLDAIEERLARLESSLPSSEEPK